MVLVFLTLPLIAILSTWAFRDMGWCQTNYQGKMVPYSLGVFVLYSYAALCAYLPMGSVVFAYGALVYVCFVWIAGYIDDRFGTHDPKGLLGHIHHVRRSQRLTAGSIKALLVVFAAVAYTFGTRGLHGNWWMNGLVGLILILSPHVANLFDTRPLRLWKLAIVAMAGFLMIEPLPSFAFLLYLVSVFYIMYVLEGERRAMLGDNGALCMGALLAVWVVERQPTGFQLGVFAILSLLTLLAERLSFSGVIERFSFLRWLDTLGISKRNA
ncbi:hypothetical protein [Shouchella shacheensis]|uniref:hypothetical protein n=1 Tax=Shouchella shacheensis TaxID=1649580 RepID=UPI00074003A5|nr:hypothetical protein [Shouchella shacheensis]